MSYDRHQRKQIDNNNAVASNSVKQQLIAFNVLVKPYKQRRENKLLIGNHLDPILPSLSLL